VIHSDSPFCEIVSRKNYFTTEIGHYGFFISSTSFYNSPLEFNLFQTEKKFTIKEFVTVLPPKV